MRRFAVLGLLIAAACGKVGPPLPPIVRTPQQVADLKVTQSGYRAVLSWTNPNLYVDNNPVSDLTTVRILQNDVVVATEPVSGPGKVQTVEIDIPRNLLDSNLTFTVVVQTEKGRSSTSNAFSIQAADVPGAPRGLKATVDQLRIVLDWEPPVQNAGLANVYLLRRSDWPTPIVVNGLHYEDAEYETDGVYTYTVTAARGESGQTPGVPGISTNVTAKDTTPPVTPVGLVVQPLEPGVFLQWMPNKERDFREYRVYRSDQPPDKPLATTQAEFYQDNTYRPGLTYQVEAVDRFENASKPSPAIPGP